MTPPSTSIFCFFFFFLFLLFILICLLTFSFYFSGLKAFDKYLSDFATATRNYAQRQLKWYRKDKNFLFVRIDRKNVEMYALDETADTKYRAIVGELLHWMKESRTAYMDTLTRQVQTTKIVTELRKSKVRLQFYNGDSVCMSQLYVLQEYIYSSNILIHL